MKKLIILIIIIFFSKSNADIMLVLSPYHYFTMPKNEGLHGIVGAGIIYQKNKSQFNFIYNFSGSILGHGAMATYDSVINMNVISIIYKYRPEIKSIGPFCHNYGFIVSTRFMKRYYYKYRYNEQGNKLIDSRETENISSSRHNFIGAYLGTEVNKNRLTIELGYAPGIINMKPALNNYIVNLNVKIL